MIEPGEGYRLLVEGEKIAEGDEVYDSVTRKWHKLGNLFAEIEWSAQGHASVRRKSEQQKGNDMSNNKLPEVGEFWDSCGYRRKIMAVHNNECATLRPDLGLQIHSLRVITDNWTYLPWCKSFDDAEPKPELTTETVVFYEVARSILGRTVIYLTTEPGAGDIQTGRTETRELPKR